MTGRARPRPRPGDVWREAVEEWPVPKGFRERHGEGGWSLEPERFRWRPAEDATQPARPSRRRAPARRRVVVEVSAQRPMAGLNPLWKSLHGIERPDRPAADDLAALAAAMGLAAVREDVVLPPREHDVTADTVAFVRRRVCAGEDRDPGIADFLRSRPPQAQRVVALWWPGAA